VYTLVVYFVPMIYCFCHIHLVQMRYMLKICHDFADEYDVKFNTNKLVAMRIGNHYNKVYEPFMLSGSNYSLYAHWNILV